MNKAIAKTKTKRKTDLVAEYESEITRPDASEFCQEIEILSNFASDWMPGTTTLVEVLAVVKLRRECDAFIDRYREEVRQWLESGL